MEKSLVLPYQVSSSWTLSQCEWDYGKLTHSFRNKLLYNLIWLWFYGFYLFSPVLILANCINTMSTQIIYFPLVLLSFLLFLGCHSDLLASPLFRLSLSNASLFWNTRPEVPQVDSAWLDSAPCPARSRNWHEFRIPEWKKRGEWTTRRQDYGWCVDFHFISLCPVLVFGIWILIGVSFCVGGWSLVARQGTVFGTTAAPSMLFQKYLQCRVCCHHSCFWLFIFLIVI